MHKHETHIFEVSPFNTALVKTNKQTNKTKTNKQKHTHITYKAGSTIYHSNLLIYQIRKGESNNSPEILDNF